MLVLSRAPDESVFISRAVSSAAVDNLLDRCATLLGTDRAGLTLLLPAGTVPVASLIEVRVLELRRDSARLGFTADRDLGVDREEVHRRIVREGRRRGVKLAE